MKSPAEVKGRAIRKWREERGLSREQLAEMCHTTYSAVANWELGRNLPNGAAAAVLDDLMTGEVAVIPLTAQEERLLDELVERGGFEDRMAFLSQAVLEILKQPTSAKHPANSRMRYRIKSTPTSLLAEDPPDEKDKGTP